MNAVKDRTALVLSGGGAYGAFGIGVMKTLFAGKSPATNYEPLTPEVFSGTSVGAFNAAIMVGHPPSASCPDPVSRLEDIWLELVADRPGRCGNGIFRIRGNPADLINPGCVRNPATLVGRFVDDTIAAGGYLLSRTANFLASSDPLENRVIGVVNASSLMDCSSFHDLLRSEVDEDKIRESPLILNITATNVITGTARYFCNDDFHDGLGIDAIMASTAIPGVFPPVKIDQDIYVDGGVVENTPLNPAIRSGATNLHVIYLDPNPRFIRLIGEANTLDTIMRVYYVMLATKIAEDVETARWINAGLDAIADFRIQETISDSAIRDIVRVIGPLVSEDHLKYRRLTIHRYFPESVLGGDLGMLDFGIDAISRMIAEGERVALVHDCQQSGCVF